MHTRFFAISLCLSLASTSAAAFSTYQSRVPNGPVARCGTCHTNANVGGEGWNDFGKDLLRQDPDVSEADLDSANQNINYNTPTVPTWDANLCGADSDGDTQTNGEELGDPNCTWLFASPPTPFPRTTDISNPGDPDSTSANPTGTDAGEEGEGEGGEGEGEGEPPGGCSSTHVTATTPMSAAGALMLALLVVRGRRRA